jgi:hypothetical protein
MDKLSIISVFEDFLVLGIILFPQHFDADQPLNTIDVACCSSLPYANVSITSCLLLLTTWLEITIEKLCTLRIRKGLTLSFFSLWCYTPPWIDLVLLNYTN